MGIFNKLCNEILCERSEKETIAKSIVEIRNKYGEQAATALTNLLSKVDYYSEKMKIFRKNNKKPKSPDPVDISKYDTPQALEKAKAKYQVGFEKYKMDKLNFDQAFQNLNQNKLNDLFDIYLTVKEINIPEADCQLEFAMGNSKVGEDTIIINMGPATICDAAYKGQCDLYKAGFCYAQNNETQHKNALVKRFRQKLQWEKMEADIIATQLAAGISQKRKKGKNIKYIRFNESGDFSSFADKAKLGNVVKMTNLELAKNKEPKVLFYTYTHRSDLFENGNDIGSKDLIIQGSGKQGHTFFVDNCFMGIDYDEAQRVLAAGKQDNYAELRKSLDLLENTTFPPVVFCRGACLGCDYCKNANKKLILVVYHGSGTKIKTISTSITKQVKELFKMASNKTLKASTFPPELKREILASNYYHENSVLEKILPYTSYTWNNKNKEWRVPMVDIDTIYDFILDLRATIAAEEAKNPEHFKNVLYYTKFKDPETGITDKDDSKLKKFLDEEALKNEKIKNIYNEWTKTKIKPKNVPTTEDEDEEKIVDVDTAKQLNNSFKYDMDDMLKENILSKKKINLDKMSMQTMSNLAVANLLHNIKGFVPESRMLKATQDAEVDPIALKDVIKSSYDVQKKMRKILKEGKYI
jgi:hypothetical protein